MDDLVYHDGILTVYSKIVIPQSLQTKMIQLAHYGHLGMTKTYELLRQHVWFPQMKSKVEQLIKKCICQCVTAVLRRGPVLMSSMPTAAWTDIAMDCPMDYKGPVDGLMILIAICKYSKYPFVTVTKSRNAKELIKILNDLFSMFGFVKSVDSDNGPPFSSHEVANFFKDRNIHHLLCTPLWSNANAQAEKFIKNLTKLIQAEKAAGRDFKLALPAFLLNYRASPHRTTRVSPAMLFFNRDVRSFLPTIEKNHYH